MSAILKGTISAPARIAAGAGIAQDNIIFAMVLFAFVVWITTKGELPIYLSFFKKGTVQGPPVTAVAASSTTGGGTPIGTVAGIPGVTTLSPGASGIVTGPGGTQLLNPGQPFSFGGAAGSIVNGLKGLFGGGVSTGTGKYTGG